MDVSDNLFDPLDLDSIFEDGVDQLGLSSSPTHDSFSLSPEFTSGNDAVTSSSSLPPAAARPKSNSNGTQLVTRSNATSIYRFQDTGIKVIDRNLPSSSIQQTLQRLLHEETVSKHLPPQCNKRQVFEVKSFNDSPALFFKWENGITVQEWLDKVQRIHPKGINFNVRLRAAMAIAKTLRQFHQSSVAYCSLSPENIVLTPFEGDYVAKFINLSCAVICNDVKTCEEMIAMDLTSLGLIFDRLFQTEGGEFDSSTRRVSLNSENNDHAGNVRNVKRGKQRTPGEGLPLYLGAMISTLLIRSDDDNDSQLRYESANDVYEDLKAMATQNISHRRSSSLKEDKFDQKVVLKLPKDLFYGRQVQLSMILHLLQSSTMIGDQPLMALIAGYPGAG
jgi:serine/threonine protein kinase